MLDRFLSVQDMIGLAVFIGFLIKFYQFKKFKGT